MTIHLAWYVWAFIIGFFAVPVVAVLLLKYMVWLVEKVIGIK